MWAASHHRREIWVGASTVTTIVGNKLAPGLLDRYLARTGFEGQQTDEEISGHRTDNLREPVPGAHGAHGRFDDQARPRSIALEVSFHRRLVAGGLSLAGLAGALAAVSRKRRPHAPPWGTRSP